jgi:S1-C subfamily serine protease
MRRAPGNQRPKRVRPPGAVALQVDPQSAAERAGLKPGDLVTELDGTPVRDAADLQLRLALLRIGEVAEFAASAGVSLTFINPASSVVLGYDPDLGFIGET